MIVLTALFIASWVAIVVLGNQGYSLDALRQFSPLHSWDSSEVQPIAIPVTDDRRSARH